MACDFAAFLVNLLMNAGEILASSVFWPRYGLLKGQEVHGPWYFCSDSQIQWGMMEFYDLSVAVKHPVGKN